MLISADVHTHSIGEGRFGPGTPDLVARHIEAALQAGLDCIAVTDHNDVRPALMAEEFVAKNHLPILILPGIEITTSQGHLLAVGVRDSIDGWRALDETIADIRSRGGIAILPHPFFPNLRSRTDVDGFERFNSRYGDFSFDYAQVALFGNSDAHNATELLNSKYHTLLEVEALTSEAVAAALREGKTSPQPKGGNGHEPWPSGAATRS